jgi:glyoxylase-like metal-dependent hydrolase (beta-lactamase superfamily II)
MLHNRGPYALWQHVLGMPVMYFFGGTGKNRYTPDIWLEDGMDLNGYGLDARVLHLPGHTRGSSGIFTAEGDLFCGDLLISHRRVPRKNRLIDDEAVMDASIEKLKKLAIRKVYPGHGAAFTMSEFLAVNEPAAQPVYHVRQN